MPPRVATRTVRLRQPRVAIHTERMQLLTYPMALAQHGATVPLIQSHNQAAPSRSPRSHQQQQSPPPPPPPSIPPAGISNGAMENPFRSDGTGAGGADDGDAQRSLPVPRRWVRDADELCIESIHRSNNINRINSYVATYKFEDPQWRPLLLPEVHVLPKAAQTSQHKIAGVESEERELDASAVPATSAAASSSSSASEKVDGFDVFIDYNKLTTLELISRHANYALRHLVQKGHAMYLVNFAQHSIVQMRGLVEASFVSCAYGIRGERLRTHIIHTGPVDVRDVMDIDPRTQRVSFNLKKANVRRGVVAVSMVEGYGTWFQRKPMLWQRTRRIGALQSQMGSYDYQLCDPAVVGRLHAYEVSLLAPHVRLMGAQGGAEAVALVASSQVAQNERLYLGQFEAPVLTAIDAVQQLAHRSALHHKLLRPAAESDEEKVTQEAKNEMVSGVYEDPQLQERRRLAGMERLLPVSWVTRTPPPYVPLESDLPFKIQLSRPAVIRADMRTGKDAPSSVVAAVAYPTGGAVGSPFVTGVPLALHEYVIHQGVDHYIFDDAPSARPLKWWNQKSNMPYNGYMYSMRSGLLDYVEAAERIPNPLAPPSTSVKAAKTTAAVTSARRRRHRHARARRHTEAAANVETSGDAAAQKEMHADSMEINLAGEDLKAGAEELAGHDDGARQEAAITWTQDGGDVSTSDRPPLHTLVAPNSTAQGRLRRYARRVSAAEAPGASKSTAGAAAKELIMPLEDRASALLQRRLRLRRLKGKKKAEKRDEEEEGRSAVGDRVTPKGGSE